MQAEDLKHMENILKKVYLKNASATLSATYLPTHRVFGNTPECPSGWLAALSWMQAFPSARVMWTSVYRAACDGTLGLVLPEATVDITIRSVAAGEHRLVCKLSVTRLVAHDEPFEFAHGHPKDIALHDCAAMDWAQAHQAPSTSIPSRTGNWRLTDAEWETICGQVQLSRRVKYPLRDIVDLIIEKLGTGVAWKRIADEKIRQTLLATTYRRLRLGGQWAIIERLLCEARGTSA